MMVIFAIDRGASAQHHSPMDARLLYRDERRSSLRDGVMITILVVAVSVVFLVGAVLNGQDAADAHSLEAEPALVSGHQNTDD
jgi:hypothetical protein